MNRKHSFEGPPPVSGARRTLRDPLLEQDANKVASSVEYPVDKSWPAIPVSLKDSTCATWLRLIPSFVLVLIPVGFYVLGFLIVWQNGKPELNNEDGEAVTQAMRVASTLWPILFAAVIGPMLKTAALYRAERGTKLGTLEVLTTSQTLINTLRGCYELRIFSTWVLLLLFVWALSPAGGQAVLRSMAPVIHKMPATYPLKYYPSNNLTSNLWTSSMDGASSGASARGKVRRAVDSALSSPDVAVLLSKGTSTDFDAAAERLGGEEQAARAAQTDPWGNVRIPFLHLMPGYDSDQATQWVEISSTEVAPYSSLIGQTVRGIPESSVGNISLQMDTMYHSFSCTPWFNGTKWLQENPSQLLLHKNTNLSIFSEFAGTSGTGSTANTFVDILKPTAANGSSASTTSTSTKADQHVLVFGARLDGGNIDMTHCEASTSYVETEVECVRTIRGGSMSCGAVKTRQTTGKPSSNQTALNTAGPAWTSNMFMEIPNTLLSSHVLEPSGLELFLRDPPTSLNDNYTLQNYEGLPMEVFQARLGLVFNTFYQASLNTTNFFGADGIGLYDVQSPYLSNYGNATGTWNEFAPARYEVKWGWLIFYFAATTVLAICAITNVILSAFLHVPDLFVGVSSLTRDSRFVTTIPGGGSTLSGTERARLLRDVWVRIQDVQPDEDVGRIAFSDGEELKSRGTLRWERKYE